MTLRNASPTLIWVARHHGYGGFGVLRCWIWPFLGQGCACGAAGPASAPGSAVGGPPGARRATPHDR